MARLARLKLDDTSAWYHIHSRMAGCKGEYPLAKPLCQSKLIDLIRFYSQVYYCHVASFCVMGNHYHLVVQFDKARDLSRKDLRARADILYPGNKAQERLDLWQDEDWEHFRKRLFDVSELMRNVQSAFAVWYNRSFERKGRLWGDRFKSVVLGDLQAVVDCMLYVDLNPVRAGLVDRPEEWQGSSIYLRQILEDKWLLALQDLYEGKGGKASLVDYRARLYYRGNLPSKEGQASIPQRILDEEAARGFTVRGVYRQRLRYFVDGVAIGTEAFLLEQLSRLREAGQVRRRRQPAVQLDGLALSLREQRSNAVVI